MTGSRDRHFAGSGHGGQSGPGALNQLRELLADRAVGVLDHTGADELDRLLAIPGAEHEAEAFDRTVAALDVALFMPAPKSAALPPNVRARVIAASTMIDGRLLSEQGRSLEQETALRHDAEPRPRASELRGSELRGSELRASEVTPGRVGSNQRRWSTNARLGWLAAAAGLGLALVAWWPVVSGRIKQFDPAVAQAAGSMPYSLARSVTPERLKEFRSIAPDIVRASWSRGGDATAARVEGEVVWSAQRQEGYMVFRGLEVNDPSVEQYQLWIFDAERDERYPVHGGVFDMPSSCGPTGEHIVRVDPRLLVNKASAFVVTVEKPGGTWVSDRKRVGPLAKIGG